MIRSFFRNKIEPNMPALIKGGMKLAVKIDRFRTQVPDKEMQIKPEILEGVWLRQYAKDHQGMRTPMSTPSSTTASARPPQSTPTNSKSRSPHRSSKRNSDSLSGSSSYSYYSSTLTSSDSQSMVKSPPPKPISPPSSSSVQNGDNNTNRQMLIGVGFAVLTTIVMVGGGVLAWKIYTLSKQNEKMRQQMSLLGMMDRGDGHDNLLNISNHPQPIYTQIRRVPTAIIRSSPSSSSQSSSPIQIHIERPALHQSSLRNTMMAVSDDDNDNNNDNDNDDDDKNEDKASESIVRGASNQSQQQHSVKANVVEVEPSNGKAPMEENEEKSE